MARRSSAGSRSSRSSRTAGGRVSTRSGGGRGPASRSDGRVDAPCPQCGTVYRVSQDALDVKLECQECHRTFFPKTTAGKRAKTQDNTKVYVGFGIGALFLVITFALMSGNSDEPREAPPPKFDNTVTFSVGTHPRTMQLVKWAQAVREDNQLVLSTHSDMRALATMMELETTEPDQVIAALRTHPSTQWLRDLGCVSGSLSSEAAMTANSGTGVVYLVPDRGDKNYRNDDRAELELAFHMDGDQVKIENWKVVRQIMRLTPDPNRPKSFKPNENIERAEMVEISDSAGTRKVMESEPGPVPHWDGAGPELRAKVDEIIAGVLLSAEDGGPPLARYTLKIRTLDERKAAVPRALNAMYELYADANSNLMKLSQLDRALRDWTGFATNFELRGTGDAAKDKALRESSVRQWFGFWWRYSSGDLGEFFDMGEDLLDGETKKTGTTKKK